MTSAASIPGFAATAGWLAESLADLLVYEI
jgi:hypothetical protein